VFSSGFAVDYTCGEPDVVAGVSQQPAPGDRRDDVLFVNSFEAEYPNGRAGTNATLQSGLSGADGCSVVFVSEHFDGSTSGFSSPAAV
jgi:hypothetical protein